MLKSAFALLGQISTDCWCRNCDACGICAGVVDASVQKQAMSALETFSHTTTRENPVVGIVLHQLNLEMDRLRFTRGCQAMLWCGVGCKAKPRCAVISDWTVRSDGEHIFVQFGQGASEKANIVTLALCLSSKHYKGPLSVKFGFPGTLLRVIDSFLAGDFTLMSLTVSSNPSTTPYVHC